MMATDLLKSSLDVWHFYCLLLNLVIHLAYLLPILQTKDLMIRSTSIQLLDHLSEGIKTWLDAPGFKIVQAIEEILLKASHGVIPELPDLSGYPHQPNRASEWARDLGALKASPAHIREIASVVVQIKGILAQYIPCWWDCCIPYPWVMPPLNVPSAPWKDLNRLPAHSLDRSD